MCRVVSSLSVVLVVLQTVVFSDCCGAGEPKNNKRSAALLVGDIIDSVTRTRDYPGSKELFGREDLFPLLKKRFPTLPRLVRKDLVGVMTRVGMDPQMRQNRWLFSRGLVEFLVTVVANDPDREVRNRAAEILVDHVPDVYLQVWGREIVAAAKKHSTDSDILLLGKTGAVEARQLLLSDKEFKRIDPRETQMALAKLGDTKLSTQFIRDFEREKGPTKKATLAKTLGYIGDAGCVLALARNIRSPLTVEIGAVRKPLRFEIAAALSTAFPETPIFWVSPLKPPQDNSWYERIEKWLQGYLGITWDQPRPPFSHIRIRPTPGPR